MSNPWKPIDDLLDMDGSFAGRRTILERYRHMLKNGWVPPAEEVIPLVEIILKECLGGNMPESRYERCIYSIHFKIDGVPLTLP